MRCIEDLREKREEVNRSILRDEEEKSKIRTRMLKEEDAYRQQVLLLEEKSAAILKASKLRLSPNETLSPVFLVRWTLA